MAQNIEELVELGLTKVDLGDEVAAVLHLVTDKDSRGNLRSAASVYWHGAGFRRHAFGVGTGGDFSKVVRKTPTARATEKAITNHHALAFSAEVRAALRDEAMAWYDSAQKEIAA